MTVQQARDNFSEIIERVALAQESFLVTKFGKPKVVIIAADKFRKLGQVGVNKRRQAIEAIVGMWVNRKDMADSAKWVTDLRRREAMRHYQD